MHLVDEDGRLPDAAVHYRAPGDNQPVFGSAHSNEASSPLVCELVFHRSVVRKVAGFEAQ
jgi:hypothetical protein